ncbi:molybdate ABC transporter substrate-binding protein (plasmid) [Bradyrhizobium sp. PMVTL-01]|uniref:molybdate ABC transporter substrate-binding protein n=1 Tax=Bradyrhizobium sp. PMVTL-01 TaxID=3434999 RepID=UPI003F6F0652
MEKAGKTIAPSPSSAFLAQLIVDDVLGNRAWSHPEIAVGQVTRRGGSNMKLISAAALGLAVLGITAANTARASEIKLLCAVALHPAYDVLIPDFEKSSGHKVTVAYGNAGAIADRFQNGESADLIINAAPFVDTLRAQGKVVAGDRIILARVGVSAFVRKGAPKPDISSVDAFKRSMLAAKSIIYPDPAGGGASGVYMVSLLERMGIAEEMKSKTKLSPSANVLYASVAGGDVEIGFNQISEVLAQPSIEFAGPLPSEIQNYTQFSPGIVSESNQAEAARALVAFLASAAAQPVLKAKGFE